MAKFNAWFIDRTSILRVILLIAVSVGLIASLIRGFDPAFQEVTAGHQIIDLQPEITPESIYADLADYTAASRQIYAWFMVADFVFPATAALAMAFFWAWLIRIAPNPIFSAVLSVPIFVLPLLTTLFDWLENVGFLTLVYRYPVELPTVASISCAIRNAKLFVMNINGYVSVALIALTVGFRLYGRLRSLPQTHN